jgi:hypothetical protein
VTLTVTLGSTAVVKDGAATTTIGTLLPATFVGAQRSSTFTLTNAGTDPLDFGVNDVAISGSAASFTVSAFTPTRISPFSTQEFTIVYAPTSDGPHPATVTLASAFSFDLTGTTQRCGSLTLAGPAGTIDWRTAPVPDPASGTDRGHWPVSAATASRLNLQLGNRRFADGDATPEITITAARVALADGSTAPGFTVTLPDPTTVAAAALAGLAIDWRPTTAGTTSGQLIIETDHPLDSRVVLPLAWTATDDDVVRLFASRDGSLLELGANWNLGTFLATTTTTLVVVAPAAQALVFSTPPIELTGAAGLTIDTDDLPALLPKGTTAHLPLICQVPGLPVDASATLVLKREWDDGYGVATIAAASISLSAGLPALEATLDGTAVTLTPGTGERTASLAFAASGASLSRTLRLRNRSATRTVTWPGQEAAAWLSGSAGFRLDAPYLEPVVLPPGAEQDLVLTFTAGAASPRTATLRLVPEEGEPAIVCTLEGRLSGPRLALSLKQGSSTVPLPSSGIDFGTVPALPLSGESTPERILVVTNPGDAPLALPAPAWSVGAGFTVLPANLGPAILAAGATRELTLRPLPQAPGAVSGTLALAPLGLPPSPVALQAQIIAATCSASVDGSPVASGSIVVMPHAGGLVRIDNPGDDTLGLGDQAGGQAQLIEEEPFCVLPLTNDGLTTRLTVLARRNPDGDVTRAISIPSLTTAIKLVFDPATGVERVLTASFVETTPTVQTFILDTPFDQPAAQSLTLSATAGPSTTVSMAVQAGQVLRQGSGIYPSGHFLITSSAVAAGITQVVALNEGDSVLDGPAELISTFTVRIPTTVYSLELTPSRIAPGSYGFVSIARITADAQPRLRLILTANDLALPLFDGLHTWQARLTPLTP